MTKDKIDFYKILLQERLEITPQVRANALDPQKDRGGVCTSAVAGDYRFFGIAEFLVYGNVTSFRTNLSKCAELQLNLLQRFNAGEPIDASYVSMLVYHELLDALAAGSMTLAVELATLMGGRPDIEKEHNEIFSRTMGYALKEAVLVSGDSARKKFNQLLSGPDENKDDLEDRDPDEGFTYRDFRGYGVVLDGIAARSESTVNHGLSMIIDGHKRQSKRGIFQDDDDQFLCVWGLGLANLARSRGINITIDHELIPRVLLM